MTSRYFTKAALLLVLGASLAGCETDMTNMDIRSLETRFTPHDALACPAGRCRVPADFESPDFAVTERDLMIRVQELIAKEPRTRLVAKDETLQQIVFVQRSRIFRFPDTIWIQSTAQGAETSIIIYSRSNYGYWDFGANKRRVRKWLAKIAGGVQPQQSGN
jgi:uncharacterized protein (DUF1499 family)